MIIPFMDLGNGELCKKKATNGPARVVKAAGIGRRAAKFYPMNERRITMKCQICQKRKGRYLRFISWASAELLVCEKCRRAECPTPAEQESDDLKSERYAEFQAELGAGCYDLP